VKGARSYLSADLHQVAVAVSDWRVLGYPHSRVTSEIIFALDGTLASPSPGCRVRFPEQLLMAKPTYRVPQ